MMPAGFAECDTAGRYTLGTTGPIMPMEHCVFVTYRCLHSSPIMGVHFPNGATAPHLALQWRHAGETACALRSHYRRTIASLLIQSFLPIFRN